MTTFLAQNQFISNSVAHPPNSDAADTAGVAPQPPVAPAGTISVSPGGLLDLYQRDGEIEPSVMLAWAPGENRYPLSDGVPLPSLSSMEMEPSVTLAQAPSETEGAVSVSAASSDISHIHEIFHYVRKLMKQPPRFVLDEAAFMADVEEEPLFLRADGYLQRREA